MTEKELDTSDPNGFVNDHVNLESGVATVTFFHPKKNSLPGKLLNTLADTITKVGQNSAAKVIVLKSHGHGAFCAGASFDELVAISDAQQGLEFFSGFSKVIMAMKSCPLIIVGKIQGRVVGGGVGLVAACDYTFAIEKASVKLSELDIGIGPFVIGPAVERKIGTSAFQAMSLDTEWKNSTWCEHKGLYSHVVDEDELSEVTFGFAAKLASKNPLALAALKKTFWEGTDHWQDELTARAKISGELVLSDFTRTAIESFKQGAR